MELKGYRILIVDDHASNRDHLRALLNLFFRETHFEEASNGENAFQKVKQAIEEMHYPPYDLIFMDYMMPVMNGEQAALHIQNMLIDSGDDEALNEMHIVTWSTSRTTPFRGTHAALLKPTLKEDVQTLLTELGLL